MSIEDPVDEAEGLDSDIDADVTLKSNPMSSKSALLPSPSSTVLTDARFYAPNV